MAGISTISTTHVAVPRERLFNWFLPVELPRILLGYGPLPAVVGTAEQTGPWDQAGSARKVLLADGTHAREQVTSVEPARSFAYRVGEFSGPVRYLTSGARGQWRFTDAAGGGTDVWWQYTFEPRSALATLLLLPLVKILWRGYMRVALDAIKRLAEQEVRSEAA